MRIWAITEQALLSLVNFGLALILTRVMEKSDWAIFSLGLVFVLFAQGFQRALISLPFATMVTSEELVRNTRHFWKNRNTKVTLGSMLFLGLLSAAWNQIIPEKWIAQSLILATIMTPGYFIQEFARRILIQQGKIKQCVYFAATYLLLITLLGLTLNFIAQPITWAIGISASGCSIGLLMLLISSSNAQPDTLPNDDLSTKANHFSKWALLCHIAYSGYTTGVQLILSYICGAPAMAIFSATRNLVQPINSLIGAIDSVDKPRAARAFATNGYSAMFSSLKKTVFALVLLGGTYLVICSFAGGIVLQYIYSGKYGEPWQEIWLWCFVSFVMLAAQPTESGLYVAQKPDALFFNRLGSAFIGLLLAFLLVPQHGVAGALVALAVGWMASASLALLQLIRLANASKTITP